MFDTVSLLLPVVVLRTHHNNILCLRIHNSVYYFCLVHYVIFLTVRYLYVSLQYVMNNKNERLSRISYPCATMCRTIMFRTDKRNISSLNTFLGLSEHHKTEFEFFSSPQGGYLLPIPSGVPRNFLWGGCWLVVEWKLNLGSRLGNYSLTWNTF